MLLPLFDPRVPAAVLTLSLLVPLAGPRRTGDAAAPRIKPWREQAKEAARHFDASRFERAAVLFRAAARQAAGQRDRQAASELFNNAFACRVALARGSEALVSYHEAKEASRQASSPEVGALLDLNLSKLHMSLGDYDGAAASAAAAERVFDALPQSPYRLPSQLHAARLAAYRGNLDDARRRLRAVLRDLPAQGRPREAIAVWRQAVVLGLQVADLTSAEQSLASLRNRLDEAGMDRSTGDLYSESLLHGAQGRLDEAVRLIEDAIQRRSAPGSGNLAEWKLFFQRGRLLRRQGHLTAAAADLREALRLARSWRQGALPAERSQTASEVGLEELYTELIDTLALLSRTSAPSEPAREALALAEENRAWTLRQRLARTPNWQQALPAAYWESLARLRSLAARSLQESEALAETQRLRAELDRMEAEAQPDLRPPGEPGIAGLARLESRLDADTVLLSFHLGQERSHLWSFRRGQVRLHSLPGRPVLSAAVARFRDALLSQESSPAGDRIVAAQGRALYRLLFGALPPEVAGIRNWVLVLDGELFPLPFAALRTEAEGQPARYLVEDHTLQIAPGSLLYAPAPANGDVALPHLLAVGDAIYNEADPRWRGLTAWQSLARWWRGPSEAVPPLARLTGSAAEIETCGTVWQHGGGDATRLTGSDLTQAALWERLRHGPGILHFAGHVLQSPTQPERSFLALSLNAGGGRDYLTDEDVARLRLPGTLVVLNGCHSGAGKALPGAGWIGMARGWLLGGASNVVASHWATPDELGPIFPAFYKAYARTRQYPLGTATSLREAQLTLLRGGTWRSRPQYWAAYFVMGRG